MRCAVVSRKYGVDSLWGTGWALVLGVALLWPSGLAWAGEADEHEDEDDDRVVVTVAPAPPESSSEATLDRQAIDAAGVRSAQDLLRTMSGLQLSQHGSEGKAAQFFVRGFDAAHGTDITIGVDGLAFNEPSHIHGHGYADIGTVIPEAVHSVRLRKGAFELDQGNLSTAADVDYRLGVPEALRGSAAGGDLGWPGRGRLWGVVAPVEGDERDVLAAEVVADAGAYENRGTERAGVIGQHTIGDWRVRGALSGARFGLPGALPLAMIDDGQVGREESLTPDTGGTSMQAWLGAVYEGQRDRLDHQTSLDVRARQFDGRENFTGRLHDATYGDERHEFQRGLSVVGAHRGRLELSDDWAGVWHAGGGGDWFDQFDDGVDEQGEPHRRHRGGTGLQGQVHLAPGIEGWVTDWLELRGGVRLEALSFHFREDEQLGADRGSELLGVIAPRARVMMYAGDDWTITAAGGRGFRGPQARVFAGDTEEFDFQMDATDVRAARGNITVVDGAEAGVMFSPDRQLQLSATAFGHYSGAEFVYDHVSRLNVDLGATRRIGAELAAQYAPKEWLRMQGHITAVDARFVDNGEPIPFAAPLEAGMMVFGQGPANSFGGVQWRAVGPQPLPFGAESAGWQLVDAHVGWKHQGWELRLNVDNVFGAEWNEGVYHFASDFDGDKETTPLPTTHVVVGHPRSLRMQVSYRW